MKKEQLAHYISSEIKMLSKHEREEIMKDLMKLKEKTVRLLAEHVEDTRDEIHTLTHT